MGQWGVGALRTFKSSSDLAPRYHPYLFDLRAHRPSSWASMQISVSSDCASASHKKLPSPSTRMYVPEICSVDYVKKNKDVSAWAFSKSHFLHTLQKFREKKCADCSQKKNMTRGMGVQDAFHSCGWLARNCASNGKIKHEWRLYCVCEI